MGLRCDVVAIGTELLLGQIIDTNSAWIGEHLALSGIDSLVQVKVGDNLARIVKALRDRLAEADAVIVCGGLGPTHDDLTREAFAALAGVEMSEDPAITEQIRTMFSSRGRTMPEINRRQAMVPHGATVIPNDRGTAPGVQIEIDGKVFYAVPGVPHEMQNMVSRHVLPDLRARAGEASAITSLTLRTWGESESGLNERLDEVINRLEAIGNPTLAFLASGWEGIKVRLTAKAANEAEARALIDPWEQEIRRVLGPVVFGTDGDTMESVVLDLCRTRGLTLGLAESVTGGLVSGRLTGIAGASDVLRGSIVSYASQVKFDVLAVPEGPVVSAEAAEAMAAGARRVLGADLGLSLTGVAGPTEQDGQPVGTLFVGLAAADGSVVARALRMPGTREQMRMMSVISALDLLRRHLLGL